MAAGFNLGKATKVVRVQNAAVAGTTVLVGSTVDTAGFDSVMFVYGVGALTATQQTKLKVGGGAASNGSDKSDLAATGTPVGAFLADADSNTTIIMEVVRPAQRYLTPSLVRGTANAVVDFGVAILYNAQRDPPVADATLNSVQLALAAAGVGGQINTVVSPAVGTAN